MIRLASSAALTALLTLPLANAQVATVTVATPHVAATAVTPTAVTPTAVHPAAVTASASPPGVFVLGIDGMDPEILTRYMADGSMPHFKQLASEGGFQQLGTSNPPQSPVAWSNFVTGMNPGGHGVYDFIHRDPATYAPISSALAPPSPDADPISALEIFGYYIPMGGEEAVNNRTGIPWWDVLTDHGVEVEVYRMPGNYPPTPSEALTLSGMGTVDLRGSAGTYTWFTDEPILDRDLKGDLQLITVDDTDFDGTPDTVESFLRGPPDFLRTDPVHPPSPTPYLTVPVIAHLDPEADVVWIEVGDADAILAEGEWSDWLTVSFDAVGGGLMPLEGAVRFYLKEARPVFRLYASPVNITASAPAQPITTPDDDAAVMLQAELGHFFTQGMPEETNALKDGLFDDDDYVKQVALVHEDGARMLELALRRFDPGDTTFVYLSDIDLQCHMLWRHDNPKDPSAPRHPAFDPAVADRHKHDIPGYYRAVDELLGEVRAALPEDVVLIVMSDHGFQPSMRQFELNAWLRDEGYLVMKAPEGDAAPKNTGILALDVDWSKTRAYGLGFNALYLNLAGREGEGIVDPADADALLAEISAKLLAYEDPKDGSRIMRRTFTREQAYTGARVAESPDLVLGYDANYGCSDHSTLGRITETQISDVLVGFTGSHLMDPAVVPGVLLSNRRIGGEGHDLTDLTVTILDHYGLPAAAGMVGEAFTLQD